MLGITWIERAISLIIVCLNACYGYEFGLEVRLRLEYN